MIFNPIIQRELIGMLRTRKAMLVQVLLVLMFAALVIFRWPSDPTVDLAGNKSQEVFRLFGYGLLTAIIVLVPVFPASSIVREKIRGTLQLLFNSPMSPTSIYAGKTAAVMIFVLLLLALSFPAGAACYVMGGISLVGDVMVLYCLLALVALQFTSLGFLVSSYSNSIDGAIRATYALVMVVTVVTLGPHLVLQGHESFLTDVAEWCRCISPLTAVMEVLGHGDVGSQGLLSVGGTPLRYVILAVLSVLICSRWTIGRLNLKIFDRARSAGRITDDLSAEEQLTRSAVWLIDPQRRKAGIGPLSNPVMVKEFRSRRFGRAHWMFRIIFFNILLSVLLIHAALQSATVWKPETLGTYLVLWQIALILLITPSLAAGLISSERESGGWQLLLMTPLSPLRIVVGKLLSVIVTILLVVVATLPAYIMMWQVKPIMLPQIQRVLWCLLFTEIFALAVTFAFSSVFRRTTTATAFSFGALIMVCVGTLAVWLGRDGPFGQEVVENVLKVNPLATALAAIDAPGFQQYELLPANWYIMGIASAVAFLVLSVQTWRLTRPQ
jgi:ABC-type transport system involved in multi-copper enzyme maturation permease subunit